MTTTEPIFDHNGALRRANDIIKRGSGHTEASKNLARCYIRLSKLYSEGLSDFQEAERQSNDDAEAIAALRTEVALYRSIVNDLSCVITQLTYSEHNTP